MECGNTSDTNNVIQAVAILRERLNTLNSAVTTLADKINPVLRDPNAGDVLDPGSDLQSDASPLYQEICVLDTVVKTIIFDLECITHRVDL